VGLFGISKGAGAGLAVGCDDAGVCCAVTDGLFATMTTLVPYMRQWFRIYNTDFPLEVIPGWYFAGVARLALRRIEAERGCRFPPLETQLGRFDRPVLMIHGEADAYIKPDMARALFDRAAGPRELWLVEGAKHNQALHVAGDGYRRRVLDFFERHLADGPPGSGQWSVVSGQQRQQTAARPPTSSLTTDH
jgi:fermentation-respiration switch protein FrsA (DUF1100 family)